jgi:hypothetical protein
MTAFLHSGGVGEQRWDERLTPNSQDQGAPNYRKRDWTKASHGQSHKTSKFQRGFKEKESKVRKLLIGMSSLARHPEIHFYPVGAPPNGGEPSPTTILPIYLLQPPSLRAPSPLCTASNRLSWASDAFYCSLPSIFVGSVPFAVPVPWAARQHGLLHHRHPARQYVAFYR